MSGGTWKRTALAAALALLAAAACRDRTEARAPTPDAGVAPKAALPDPFTFTAGTENLLFSALEPSGEPITADKVADIPEPLRGRVMVVDLSKTPEQRQADKFVFFADLTRPDAQQRFVANPMSRYQLQAAPRAGAALAPAEEGAVVIYTAAWCGFCKKAKAYLKQKGVAFVERDVEASAAAARELNTKLRSAGASGGGVPVIDVDGTLVMGFDRARLDELLARRADTP